MKNIHSTENKFRKYICQAAMITLIVVNLLWLNACLGLSSSSGGQQKSILSLADSSLSFGNVTAGSNKTLTVAATNSGPNAVTISGVSSSTKYFSVTGPALPITIQAGQSSNLSVEFTPNAVAAFNAVVTLNSDASDATASLSLSGSGVAAGQLGTNPATEDFGTVTVGSKPTLTQTLQNTGSTSITVTQVGISGTGFSFGGISAPLTLLAGQSANFKVYFAPQAAGPASGNLTVLSDASNSTATIALSGTGATTVGQIGANPASIAVGNVAVGSSGTATCTLTASGASVTVTAASTNNSVFSVSGLSLPTMIAAGQSTTFSVSFVPKSTGAVTGNLTITSNASDGNLTVPLTGTGTAQAGGQLTVSPAPLALGTVVVGTSGTASGSLTASGASVTITAASTNNSAFTISGLSLPVTIPAGQSTTFSATFSPKATGAASATLTFTSNAQPTTTNEILTGTGTPAPVHSVSLSWNASTSSDVSGYNIYRAVYADATCGSYAKINAVLNTSTLYTDNSVVDGTAYCYATTAVDTSNQESGYSNIASNVQIPAP